jgi:hypothetical protein
LARALGIDAEESRCVGGQVERLSGAGLPVDGSGDCGLRLAGEFPGNLEIDLAAGDGE